MAPQIDAMLVSPDIMTRASTNVRFRTILRYEGRFYKGTDSYKSYKLVQTPNFSVRLMPYLFKSINLSKFLSKGLQIKKWTDFQAHNSRSIAARVKRPSPADS